MQDLNQALLILLVGMLTVFLILSLVVLTAWGLIWLTNHWVSEPKSSKKITPIPARAIRIPNKKLAAITAAVDIITEGEARIERIEKL